VIPAVLAAEDANSNALQSKPRMRRDEKPFDFAVFARLFHYRSVYTMITRGFRYGSKVSDSHKRGDSVLRLNSPPPGYDTYMNPSLGHC
jgi:hypothetical protein